MVASGISRSAGPVLRRCSYNRVCVHVFSECVLLTCVVLYLKKPDKFVAVGAEYTLRSPIGSRRWLPTFPFPGLPFSLRFSSAPKSYDPRTKPNQIPHLLLHFHPQPQPPDGRRRRRRRRFVGGRVGLRRRRGRRRSGGRLGLRRLRQPQLRLPLALQPLQAAAPPRRPQHPARLQVAAPRRGLDLHR